MIERRRGPEGAFLFNNNSVYPGLCFRSGSSGVSAARPQAQDEAYGIMMASSRNGLPYAGVPMPLELEGCRRWIGELQRVSSAGLFHRAGVARL